MELPSHQITINMLISVLTKVLLKGTYKVNEKTCVGL